jgi:hypothetical protein
MDTRAKNVYSRFDFRATVAQMAEHLTRNEDVRGSIPRGGSISNHCSFVKTLDWFYGPGDA